MTKEEEYQHCLQRQNALKEALYRSELTRTQYFSELNKTTLECEKLHREMQEANDGKNSR